MEQTFREMGFMLNTGLLFARPSRTVKPLLERGQARHREAFARSVRASRVGVIAARVTFAFVTLCVAFSTPFCAQLHVHRFRVVLVRL